MIVVDASVMVDLLLGGRNAEKLFHRLTGDNDQLHAPHLLDVEVAQVFRRFSANGELKNERAASALQLLQAFPLSRYPHAVLLPRIWELRGNLTAYDAAYVALAEVLDATLVTRDRRLGASPGHSAAIEVI